MSSAIGFLLGTTVLMGHAIAASGTAKQQEGFRRLALGDFTVMVVSDGTTARDVTKLITKIPTTEVLALTSKNHQPQTVEISINTFLIDTDTQRILIDAGAGDLFKPEGGLLVQNLKAAGYQPSDITAVILTHIHADHSGGLVLNGHKLFTHATVFIPERDFAFFMNKDEEAKAPAAMKHIWVEAQKTIGPYVSSKQVKTFAWNTEILPGITSLPAAGHTPGHSYIVVENKGQKLLILSDTIHVAEVQFPKPAAAVALDFDQDAAAEQRKKGLEEAASSGSLVALQHVSFPGLGHINKDGKGYMWIPLPYSVRR